MSDYPRCLTCRHWIIWSVERPSNRPIYGHCGMMNPREHPESKALMEDVEEDFPEVSPENGPKLLPDFGCVQHEVKS